VATKTPTKSRSSAEPRFVPPMQATLVRELPEGDGWVYELKFDGYRVEAIKAGETVRLISRNEKNLTEAFPAVRDAISTIKAKSAVLDGEIVAIDDQGRPSFQALQHRTLLAAGHRLVYYAFDLLHLDGRDLAGAPLHQRKRALEKILRGSRVLFSAELEGTAEQVVEGVKRLELEGVVAKRRDSRYEPANRSGAWLKVQFKRQQEFVIGGYKPESRSFQSLVVGYYENRTLRFAGRVRAGFTPAQRTVLFERLKPLQVEQCPFADLPSARTGHWGEGVTAEDMKVLKWVWPRLVVEIAFTEWTRDGHLRHSSFVGFRPDKRPSEVVREIREVL